MSSWNFFSWYWLVWAITLFATFLPVELYAAFTDATNTLSWNVWKAEQFIPGSTAAWTAMHWVIGLGSIVLFGWLALHFAFGWLNP